MVKSIYFRIALLLLMPMLWACKKEALDIPTTEINQPVAETDLDRWLNETFAKPYNIQVVYKQSAYKDLIAPNNTLPDWDKVKPVMEVFKTIWLDKIETCFGQDFVRKYAPLQIRLYGSPNFNNNGVENIDTKNLGPAIMPLYGANSFDPEKEEEVYRMLRQISFYFIKNMIDKTAPDYTAFAKLNFHPYDPLWQSKDFKGLYTDRSAVMAEFGFLSKAAQADVRTDFIESMSILFCQLPKQLKPLYEVGPYEKPTAAKITLQNKIQMVDAYLEEHFGIKRVATISRILPRAILKYAQDKRAEKEKENENKDEKPEN